MKKLIPTLILVILFTVSANSQILNPGFETWTSGDPDNWTTTNIPLAGLLNITQTTDKHSGSSAVKGAVASFQGITFPPFVISGPGGEGFTISQRYTSLVLFYKFTSVGGDKFSVNILMNKGKTTLGVGAVALPSSVTAYTQLSVPINYTASGIPDTAIIELTIIGPNGSDYHLGSVMFADDLSFSTSNGIENALVSDLIEKSYPNPSRESVNIPLNGALLGYVDIFDMAGRQINSTQFESQSSGDQFINIPVSDFSSGIYYYFVRNENLTLKGKFTVCR